MSSRVVTNYAKALFSYAKEVKTEERVYEDMKLLGEAILNDDYRSFVKTKLVNIKSPLSYFDKELCPLLGSTSQEMIHLICTNKRVEILLDLPRVYCDLYEKEENITRVIVTSVVSLSKKQEKEFQDIIQKSYPNQELKIKNVINPSLIGGFRIQVENFVVKVDLRSKLNQVKKSLIA